MTFESRLAIAGGQGRLIRASWACAFLPDVSSTDPGIIEAIRAALTRPDPLGALGDLVLGSGSPVPAFAMIAWAPPEHDGAQPTVTLMARGDITIRTNLTSSPTLTGTGVRTWVEHRNSTPVGRLEIAAGEAATADTDLGDGIVAASGFELVLDPATLEGRTPGPEGDATPPAGSPASPESADRLQALKAAAASTEAAPDGDSHRDDPDPETTLDPAAGDTLEADAGRRRLASARPCPDGHLNAPHLAECRRCGRSIATEAGTITVEQPVLGLVGLPDGRRIPLDGAFAIGRNPTPEGTRRDTAVTPVALDAPTSVSRTHVLLEASGWSITVTDCGSRSGTALIASGDDDPIELLAWTPHEVTGGDVIYLGGPTMISISETPS